MKESSEPLLTYEEAARLLNVPKATLFTWVRTRRLPHVRLAARSVRFRRDDLLEWLDGCVVSTTDGNNTAPKMSKAEGAGR